MSTLPSTIDAAVLDPGVRYEAEFDAERAMAEIANAVGRMRAASPGEAEEMHARIRECCADERLPGAFRKHTLERALAFECDANMREADKALAEAMALSKAAGDNAAARLHRLEEGRKLFAKACLLGANDDFRRAAQRRIDTIMMTGSAYRPGMATRAKPPASAFRSNGARH